MLTVKQISVAECKQMGALLTGVEKMMALICRCQIYEALYLKAEQLEQEEWKQAVKTLTSALATLYTVVLGFLGSAMRTYDQSIMIRTGWAILNPSKVIDLLEHCQTLESNVAIEVDNCERIYTRQFQARSEQIQKIQKLLEDLQTPMLRMDSRVATLCKKLEGSERRSILEWISGIRFEENHFFACQGRTNGTGEWLLRHKQYCEWRASSASMMLWLHGDRECQCTRFRKSLSNEVRQLVLARQSLFLLLSMIFYRD